MKYCSHILYSILLIWGFGLQVGCVSSQRLEEFRIISIKPEIPGVSVIAKLKGISKKKHIPLFYLRFEEKAPYRLYFGIDTDSERYKRIMIHSALLVVNNSEAIPILKEDEPAVETTAEAIVITQQTGTDKWFRYAHTFEKELDIDFKTVKMVKVILRASFINEATKESHTIELLFEPSVFEKRRNYIIDWIISV